MRADHRPRRRFAQHFLHASGVIERIVAAVAPRPGEHLVEIGPGRGALTGPLLERTGALTVIEVDRELAARLDESMGDRGHLEVINRDALEVDFDALAGTGVLRIVGNLPYNISTPLIFHLLGQTAAIRDMHFMLQREVVDRMVASPGSRTYGRLSVMVQMRCEATKLFTVGPGAFHPPPRVRSAVVCLRMRSAPPVEVHDPEQFARLVSRLFSHRRKTLRATLKGRLGADEIEAAGIDPGARAETLDLAAFARLANAMRADSAS